MEIPDFPAEFKKQWFIMGCYFGYPPCCIESFCNLSHFGKPRDCVQFTVASGHGFIPCESCAHKVASGKITLEGLIRRRGAISPFPLDHGEDEFENVKNWMEGLAV